MATAQPENRTRHMRPAATAHLEIGLQNPARGHRRHKITATKREGTLAWSEWMAHAIILIIAYTLSLNQILTCAALSACTPTNTGIHQTRYIKGHHRSRGDADSYPQPLAPHVQAQQRSHKEGALAKSEWMASAIILIITSHIIIGSDTHLRCLERLQTPKHSSPPTK